MTAATQRRARPVPRALLRLFWAGHRTLFRITGGRLGLARPQAGKRFGMMRLTTTGRRTSKRRSTMVGYYEDGPNLVTMAMNGWGTAEPAWWLNLKSTPSAHVALPDGPREVVAREATGDERDRLWAKFRDYPGWGDDLEGLAALRNRDTAVVVLEPRARSGAAPI